MKGTHRGNHYDVGGISTIEYIKAKLTSEQYEGFLLGNIHKYVSRYQYKDGLKDLKKARDYLNWLIELHEQKEREGTDVLVKIKLKPGAKLPYRSSAGAAGWDLFAYIDQPLVIEPLKPPYMIPTGVMVELPPGTYWDVRIRSGLAAKHGLILANGAAVVDEDYRGEVFVPVVNLSNKPYVVQPGEKIAQAILMRYEPQEFKQVDELSETARGTGGFGSTGRGV